MGRLWLALALVASIAVPALADRPRPPPPPPTLLHAELEIGGQRTSSGLYDVEAVRLTGTFPEADSVRIVLDDSHKADVPLTTPDHVELLHPRWLVPLGTTRLFVRSIGLGHASSALVEIDVVAQRRHVEVHDGTGRLELFVVTPFAIALLAVLAILVIGRRRARARAAAPLEPIALSAAEHLARAVRLRALVILGALVAAGGAITALATEDAVVIGFFIAPALLVLAFIALMRLIDAIRTLRLLAGPSATAAVRFDQIEVTADGDRHTLRASRWLVDRARLHALPRATL